MAAYKDEKRGTWFVSFHYNDWTGKNCRKVKRGFKTRREAVEWEQHFLMKEGSDLDMTFSEFVAAYTRDMQPKLKHNTGSRKNISFVPNYFPILRIKKCGILSQKILSSGRISRFPIAMKKGNPMHLHI